MKEKLQKIIKEQMTFLPKEMQEAINSLDWAKIAEEIGRANMLTEDEITNLQTETFLVLTGLEEGEAYVRNIENEIGTSKDEAEKIADEAEEKIFGPIYDNFSENVKNNLKSKNPGAKQTLNFILSGGDYSALGEGTGNASTPSKAAPQEGNNTTPPKPVELRDNLVM